MHARRGGGRGGRGARQLRLLLKLEHEEVGKKEMRARRTSLFMIAGLGSGAMASLK